MSCTRREAFQRALSVGLLAASPIGLRCFAAQPEEMAPPRTAAQQPRWAHEWRSNNLIFHSDFELNSQTAVVASLQQLRADLEKSLQINISNDDVHLIVFAEQRNYQGYMQQHFPDVPQRRALFIKRRGPGMVFAYRSRELDIDLRHETTHALLNASLPYVPLWLDEGLAEYFEVEPSNRDSGATHIGIVRLAAMFSQVTTIENLEAIADLASMSAADYRAAWSWVHFLLHDSDASRNVLTRFLQDLQSGFPPGPFSRRLASDLPDYRARYVRHFRKLL